MKYFLVQIIETEEIETKLNHNELKESLHNLILSKIRESYIHNITHNNDYIKFKAPIFRLVWNGFNLFNPISKADIRIESKNNKLQLKYNFFFFEFFVYALIFSATPFIAMLPDIVYRILFFLGIWVIYFISTMIAAHRFENFIKKYINNKENLILKN
ncbi:MAG: hypothetical protein U9Q83_01700 [Bacteroidota bacterium]|nr:hypothetical protein [Bacteroidota bacterium]